MIGKIKINITDSITEENNVELEIARNIGYKALIKLIEQKLNIQLSNYKLYLNDIIFGESRMGELENDSTIELVEDIDPCKIIKECFINTKMVENKDNESDDEEIERGSLSGILTICLLKYLAKDIDNKMLSKIKPDSLKEIIETIKKDINFKGESQSDIKAILQENSGNNIFEYCKYIRSQVSKKELDYILNLFQDNSKKQKIEKFWTKLMRFEDFNAYFEKELEKSLRMCYFEYSVISLCLYEKSKRKQYLEARKNCPNCVKRILFHGTQIDPIAKIITTEFKNSRKPFYGMGIYFSDMLDYVCFYAGGNDYKTRRANFGKILPAGQTFSCIGAEAYYDESKFKFIYDFSLFVKELNDFPTYEDLQKYYPDKMVEKNGIHFIKVNSCTGGQVIEKDKIKEAEQKGTFIGTEYVITEQIQFFPLYGLTLKRNEYFVIWRDPNFEGENRFKDFLAGCKLFLNKEAQMNVYFESSTEEALKLVYRKRYNKIILISSIGKDLSGKKFVEIARKILGFKAMVLFFSCNTEHFSWLKNFQNFLYTNSMTYYEKYVMNYNNEGLKKLKNEVQGYYKGLQIPDFTNDYLSFPNYKQGIKYSEVNFVDNCKYIKTVKIFNQYKNLYINMNKNGVLSVDPIVKSVWTITLDDDNNEITLFSNNYYLYKNEEGNPATFPYMKRGQFKKVDNYYCINFGDKRLAVFSKSFTTYSLKFKANENQMEERFIFEEV